MTNFEKLIKTKSDIFDFSDTKYVNKRIKIKVTCKKCGAKLEQIVSNLLSIGCAKCNRLKKIEKLKEDFIKRANEIHGGIYDYSKVVWTRNDVPVTIVCNKGHEFKMTPANHASKNNRQGCSKCSGKGPLSLEERKKHFIRKAEALFGDHFKYDVSGYVDTSTKISLRCNIHRKWLVQTPGDHLSGRNPCEECHNLSRSLNNPGFVTRDCKGFSICHVYVLAASDGKNSFIKVGVSTKPLERVKAIRRKGYAVKLLKSRIFTSYILAGKLEKEILGRFKEFSFSPRKRFKGYTECLQFKVLNKVLRMVDSRPC